MRLLRALAFAPIVTLASLSATPAALAAQAAPTATATSKAVAMTGTTMSDTFAALHGPVVEARSLAFVTLVQNASANLEALSREHATRRKAIDTVALAWVKAQLASHSSSTADADALVHALLASPTLAPGQEAALDVAVVHSALAHASTLPAARALLAAATEAPIVFRPELSRQIRAQGDRAVPGLIIMQHHSNAITRTWATNELESLGKKTASDAVQAKESAIVSDVLRAYGQTRDLDAIGVITAFINTDRVEIREAAREALRAFGPLASTKARESFANLTGQPAPPQWNADALLTELFRACDRARFHDDYALLDEGLEHAKTGHLREAIQSFEKALARNPNLDRRSEMIPAYVAFAKDQEPTDRTVAQNALRSALSLSPTPERRAELESELAYLEGISRAETGASGSDAFERALALDPANVRARASLDALRVDHDARRAGIQRTVAIGSGAAALLVVVAFAFALRRRPA